MTELKCYSHKLQSGKSLLSPNNFSSLNYSGQNKVFLGLSSSNPFNTNRVPLWMDIKDIYSSILIGGSIGSGKSTLVTRLVAGCIKQGLTVIIGEAKGGKEINPKRAAFHTLSNYLSQQFSIPLYRWPRGNCTFNPLLSLNNLSTRKTFMYSILKQIKTTGEREAFVIQATDIAALILELLETLSINDQLREKICTFRHLIECLKNPEQLLNQLSNYQINLCESSQSILDSVKSELERLNFFELAEPNGREKFAMTAGGINDFINILEEEDLLYYTEPHNIDREGNPLVNLNLDEIIFEQAIVVISQPLTDFHASGKIIGTLFWDSLLNRITSLALPPIYRNGKERRGISAFLDETHRLPTGRLSESGEFLREYKLGIIEILPTIGDRERWDRNKHVYQTIISTSPGVPEVTELIASRLTPRSQDLFEPSIAGITSDRRLTIGNDYQHQPIPVHPGLLRTSGKFTALLYSDLITDKFNGQADGLFWIDLNNPLMENLNALLTDALDGNITAVKLVNYTFGLTTEFP
jgi:RecA/RadA recombinase